MSLVPRAVCPHIKGVFVRLDGAEPYPWVHDATGRDARGALEVCDLLRPATAEEAGEVCGACFHQSGRHQAEPGPIPAGLAGKPRRCNCGCLDFRRQPGGPRDYTAEARAACTWVAILSCGCETRVGSEPKIGGYLSCASRGHQTSYRINGARPIGDGSEAPAAPLQLALFGGDLP